MNWLVVRVPSIRALIFVFESEETRETKKGRGITMKQSTNQTASKQAARQTKFIFVTGGVVSGLGKGITAASLGRLLKERGLKVAAQKLDPYINVDPGTMSPYQHGEVFVTEDGAETDLDLGHYERFIDEDLNRFSNLTSGKVYWNVLNKERRGEYLGETVQVIPHITNEIKSFIYNVGRATDADVVITEVGGTTGDIESQPFLEAIRQVGLEVGPGNALFIHVTLVPYLRGSDEHKSKPTQHSVKNLQGLGIKPDIIIGCAGGGSNLGGLIAPFMGEKLRGEADYRIIAVEPASCPSFTRGQFKYDFCDTGMVCPLAKMYTLGSGFIPSANHAGGLRYHGMSPILSQLYHDGLMEARSVEQTSVFEAAEYFARTEGILPAPESSHAIRAAIDEALKCKETGEERTIVFGLTGTGYFDLVAYQKFNDHEMTDIIPTDEQLAASIAKLPKVAE